jgi:cysteinyl-tRNA synthetase
MFRPPHVPEGTYGSWDDNGIPLTDGTGAELSKSKAKGVQKDWAAREKLHQQFLKWQAELNA